MLSARLLSAHEKKGTFARAWDRGITFLEGIYTAFIARVLRHSFITVLVGAAIFVGSIGIATLVKPPQNIAD
jgi:multidrug efflux pump subunit AcrB